MHTLESKTIQRMTLPEAGRDLDYAAGDPLTSPSMLWRIFREYDRGDDSIALDYIRLSSLVSNPALSSDMFAALLIKLKRGEDKHCSEPRLSMSYDFLSDFFINPLTTFEQILDIVINSVNLKGIAGLEDLRAVKTVVELFDGLRPLLKYQHREFLSKLLCSPLISDEDFHARIWLEEDGLPKLGLWTIFSNQRFIPSAVDYERALKELSSFEFKAGLSIVINENASPEFLVEALKHAGDRNTIEGWVHQNLNCPIELSASFHLEYLKTYDWRLSYLIKLEAKVDEYLNATSGDNGWSDLPLLWKFRIIAE